MPPLIFATSDLSVAIYVIAACATAIAGILTAHASVVKARKEGSEDCEKHLQEARLEAESSSTEVHNWRMRFPGVDPSQE